MDRGLLLPDAPYPSLDDYLAADGGAALPRAIERGPDWVIDELEQAGLRARRKLPDWAYES